VIILVNVLYLCYELLKEDSTPEFNIRNCEVWKLLPVLWIRIRSGLDPDPGGLKAFLVAWT
jgi:hypothetical protein